MLGNVMENKPNILVVDDTPANLITIKTILKKVPLNIYTADSGNQALKMLLGYKFNLILMDVVMPIMDGYETAELITAHDEFRTIPILFVTARDENLHSKKTILNCTSDYLYKPIDQDILIQKIKALINLEV